MVQRVEGPSDPKGLVSYSQVTLQRSGKSARILTTKCVMPVGPQLHPQAWKVACAPSTRASWGGGLNNARLSPPLSCPDAVVQGPWESGGHTEPQH